MKFGISAYNWVSPFSTKTVDLIAKVKAMGFDVFEITCEQPEIIDLEVVKREIEENDLDATVCTVMGPGRDLSTDDPEMVRSTMGYLHWCIKAAEFLGSPIISGPLYSYVGKTRLLPEVEKYAERKRAVDNLKKVAVIAADHNVKLALEPLNRFEIDMINTVDQGLALIDEIDHPSVGFLLDSFHMHIEEKDSAQAIRKAGEKLFHFHSCENDRGVPGSGQVDWTGIRQALQDINYSGSMVIESFTRELEAIARAVSLWRPLAPDQDTIAIDGLAFLQSFFKEQISY